MTEAVTEAAPVVEAPAKVYDWAAIEADDNAPVGPKMLAKLAPLHEKLASAVEAFKAVTDVDTAVSEYVANSTDEQDVKSRELIEKAQRMIDKETAALTERARTALIAKIDPNFDEAKANANINDLRNAAKALIPNIRGWFSQLGYLESDVSEAGRETNFRAKNEMGALFLKYSDLPKVGKDDNKAGASDAVKEFNRNAKEYGRTHGMKVADKGALSLEVKEAYSKASGVPIPSK